MSSDVPAGTWLQSLRWRLGCLAVSFGLAALVIWAMTGAHEFWPGWVWFGFALPAALVDGVRWALRSPAERRWLTVHAVVSAILAAAEVVIWALSGFGYFWPIWPILALALLLAVHVWVVPRQPSDREQALADRISVLSRTRRGALDVQAAELRRIERDLHDGAQARLVSVGMSLGLAEELLETDPDLVAELLAEARSTTMSALDDLRTVMRGIQPPVLADRGLEGAIEALALDVAVPVTPNGHLTGRAPAPVESAVYFAVAECLANVVKHSGATQAWVTLQHRKGVLSVVVGDNGVGGAKLDAGTGLPGIARRLEPFDGTMDLCSPAGGPTTVTMEVPCELSLPKISPSSGTV